MLFLKENLLTLNLVEDAKLMRIQEGYKDDEDVEAYSSTIIEAVHALKAVKPYM